MSQLLYFYFGLPHVDIFCLILMERQFGCIFKEHIALFFFTEVLLEVVVVLCMSGSHFGHYYRLFDAGSNQRKLKIFVI